MKNSTKVLGLKKAGVAAFREEVSNNMRREMKTASRNKLKTKVMDALVAAVDVTVPESLVSNEILQLKNQALQQMGGAQGVRSLNVAGRAL